ncbi:hypothetical protein M434DRAFT_400246 [Hypoxylon sp. CO27-5]|nr:hypothetical protein M434DRAFT_400246 [Hypoxylon sp. CO27-5]
MTAGEQASSPDGVTDVQLSFKEFDFSAAFNFIKGKVDDEFIQYHWQNSLMEASRICDPNSNTYVSVCWYSIKFLDALWSLLFGKTNGPSPWEHFLGGLQWNEQNGSADHTMVIFRFIHSPGSAEPAIQGLFKYFPMKLLMPKFVTLTSSATEPQK